MFPKILLLLLLMISCSPKYDGTRTEWHKNGQKSFEVEYIDGVKEGAYRSWFKDGRLKVSGNYKNGKADGIWTMWDEEGKIIADITFKDGFRAKTGKNFKKGLDPRNPLFD